MVKMSSKNLNQTQRLFGELSLQSKSGVGSPSSSTSNGISSSAVSQNCAIAAANASSGSAVNGHFHHPQQQPQQFRRSSASSSSGFVASQYKHSSPEIHDLIRFQHAIMLKYQQTHDPHFKNIADALKPQIDEKIRDFHRST